MRRKKLLAKLEELADRLGVKVRYENLGQSRGGLCRIKGELYIFVNKRMSPASRIELLSEEIATFDLSEMYLLPEVRDHILKYQPVHPSEITDNANI